MSEARTNTGGDRRKPLRVVAVYALVMFLVAVMGAIVGWTLGSAGTGAIFGAVFGYFGCVVGGYLLEDAYRRVS